MIITFFRDYHRIAAPLQTINVVASPTVLIHLNFVSVKRNKSKETRNKDDLLHISVLHQRLPIHLDALHRRHIQKTSNLPDPFAVKECTCTPRMYTCLLPASTAQHVATPTTILNFREVNFHDQKSNHEIHVNILPQKFEAIRYRMLHVMHVITQCT